MFEVFEKIGKHFDNFEAYWLKLLRIDNSLNLCYSFIRDSMCWLQNIPKMALTMLVITNTTIRFVL